MYLGYLRLLWQWKLLMCEGYMKAKNCPNGLWNWTRFCSAVRMPGSGGVTRQLFAGENVYYNRVDSEKGERTTLHMSSPNVAKMKQLEQHAKSERETHGPQGREA